MPKVYGNRWQVVTDIDEGGQGWIYLVSDLKDQSGSKYVLKRLKNESRKDWFRKEAETTKSLDHPNILKVIDFNIDDEDPYMITEYCPDGNLQKAKPFWRNSIVEALELFEKICEAVHYAHSFSPIVVHRDIKPANLFLRGREPVLGDFGLCYLEDGTRFTMLNEQIGSRLYMPPEFEDGRADAVTPEADVYSLGKLLYWLVSPDANVFSRERHRDTEWDLVKKFQKIPAVGFDSVYLEHINLLLDTMVVADPNDRDSVANILPQLRVIKRLIQGQYTPIQSLEKPCKYCGLGIYKSVINAGVDITNFGFTSVAGSDWRILVCDNCGHVQLFRIENARGKDLWGPGYRNR